MYGSGEKPTKTKDELIMEALKDDSKWNSSKNTSTSTPTPTTPSVDTNTNTTVDTNTTTNTTTETNENTTTSSGMGLSDQEKQIFNDQWKIYEGRDISASSVRTMVSAIITNNNSSDRKITVNGVLPTEMPTLDTTKNYSIALTYDAEGYVNGITYNEI